jgi:hypothetical protein
MEPSSGSELCGCSQQEPSVTEDSEIAWHREQIAKNRALLDEIEAGNTDGAEVFPETRSEIDRLRAQIAQSELIVAAYEKEHPSQQKSDSGSGRRLVIGLPPSRVILHQLDNRAPHRRVLDLVEGPQQPQRLEIFFLVVHHLSPSPGRDTTKRAACCG